MSIAILVDLTPYEERIPRDWWLRDVGVFVCAAAVGFGLLFVHTKASSERIANLERENQALAGQLIALGNQHEEQKAEIDTRLAWLKDNMQLQMLVKASKPDDRMLRSLEILNRRQGGGLWFREMKLSEFGHAVSIKK